MKTTNEQADSELTEAVAIMGESEIITAPMIMSVDQYIKLAEITDDAEIARLRSYGSTHVVQCANGVSELVEVPD